MSLTPLPSPDNHKGNTQNYQDQRDFSKQNNRYGNRCNGLTGYNKPNHLTGANQFFKLKHSHKLHGFTLVELIVVITILAILGTIAFLSLQGYSRSARDSVRISNLSNLHKGLSLFHVVSGIYPMPEGQITISASGTDIGYQGYAKDMVGSIAKLSLGIGQDPLDSSIYTTYSVNTSKTRMQLMSFLEDGGSVSAFVPSVQRDLGEIFPTTYASFTSDYSKRYPMTKGDALGILLASGSLQPVQETNTGVDIVNTSSGYALYFTSKDTLSGTGFVLGTPFQINMNNGGPGFGAPSSCPTGFISVPGNKEFNQPGFCVAKYEMSYSDADTPTSCDGAGCPSVTNNTPSQTDWNTVTYVAGRIPVSLPNKFPIGNINQSGAIASCKSMGPGYHLITNNEWMTIARNIEANALNWSTGITGSWYISNGVSGDAALGCGGGNTQAQYPSLSRNWATKTGEGGGNTVCDSKRQLTLSNNQIIWDLAGNVWEHVNKANTMEGGNYGTGWTNLDPADTDWHNTGWTASVFDPVRKLYGPSNNTYTHTTNGVGNIYGVGGTTLATGNIFLRGGIANYGSGGGVFSLHLHWSSATADRPVGFRCAR